MKLKHQFLLALFFLAYSANAQLDFSPAPGHQTVCPGSIYSYTASGCSSQSYSWTVTNGRFYNSANTGATVSVIWNDVAQKGKLTVSCNGGSASKEYVINSVRGQTPLYPRAYQTAVYCNTSPISIAVDEMTVPNTGGVSTVPLKYVDGYEFTLPSGWTLDGKTGIVYTTSPLVSIQPTHGCSGGNVTVRGFINCSTPSFSNAVTINVNRATPTITLAPESGYGGAGCGNRAPVVFTVTSNVPCVSNYVWSFPAGWRGPGGVTSPVTTTTSSITLTPSGTSADKGAILAKANLDCGSQLTTNAFNVTYTEPTLTVSGPTSVCVQGSTYSYVLANASASSVTWSSSSILNINPSTGFASLKPGMAGVGTVTATAATGCGNISGSKTVQVGLQASFSGPSYIGVNNSGTFNATASCGPSPYYFDWFIKNETEYTGEPYLIGSGRSITLKSVSDPTLPNVLSRTFSLYIRVYDASNAMIYTTTQYITTKARGKLVLGSGGPVIEMASTDNKYTLYPNPATNSFKVENTATSENTLAYSVTVFDDQGNKLLKTSSSQESKTIETGNLRPGTYIIHISTDEGIIERKKVIVKK
jgi:hypothetical protein